MKIGIMGGSFDPVHKGHLSIARDALAGVPLDKVLFVPAAQAPLKAVSARAPSEDRLEMLRLAVLDLPDDGCFEVCDFEIEKGGMSYSLDTARELRRRFAGDELFWIIGADQAERLGEWRGIRALAELVEFVVMRRPGFSGGDSGGGLSRLPWVRWRSCAGRETDVSSTLVRERVARGMPVDDLMPRLAVEYLKKNGLYRLK